MYVGVLLFKWLVPSEQLTAAAPAFFMQFALQVLQCACQGRQARCWCRADVYMALLCLVPNLLAASWARARHLSVVLGMGWLVVNPWVATMAGPLQPRGWPLLHFQWLTNVSFVTYVFVWLVYVPSWVLPWWSLRGQRQIEL